MPEGLLDAGASRRNLLRFGGLAAARSATLALSALALSTAVGGALLTAPATAAPSTATAAAATVTTRSVTVLPSDDAHVVSAYPTSTTAAT
jgi:hypothetical protein